MDSVILGMPIKWLNIDKEHRAVCITMDGQKKVRISGTTQRNVYRACNIPKSGTFILRESNPGYEVADIVECYTIAEAPPSVKAFILKSGLLKAEPGVKVEYLDLLIGIRSSDIISYWIRVKEVE